jgi:hypothetical protein
MFHPVSKRYIADEESKKEYEPNRAEPIRFTFNHLRALDKICLRHFCEKTENHPGRREKSFPFKPGAIGHNLPPPATIKLDASYKHAVSSFCSPPSE